MPFFRSLRQQCGRRARRSWASPTLEALEDRLLPAVTLVQAFSVTGGSPTASDNDYTRISQAVRAVASGDTITLQGTFDWTESHAAASWALGSDGVAGTDDDYSILAPANVHDVTVTAASPGSAEIRGPGATHGVDLTGVFFFEHGPDRNWTISNLRIVDFDFGIAFTAPDTTDAYDGTRILNNTIHLATNLNTTVDPAYVFQNYAINFSFGKNQTIQGNTIEFDGDGVSDPVNGSPAVDVGIQCDTSAPGVYGGLLIDGNVFHVLRAQSSAPEIITGIWENTHDTGADITVSNNQFVNLAAGNDPTLNRQAAFEMTAGSGDGTTVTWAHNTVSGANVGFQWTDGLDFSAGQAVRLWQNTITDAGVGVLVRSGGAVNLWRNTVTGSKTAAVMVTGGGRLEASGSVSHAVQENVIRGGAAGVVVQGDAGVVGPIYDNDLSGNTGFGVDDETGITVNAQANWWGSTSAAVVAGQVHGPVTFAPVLLFGTDTQPNAPGFQGDLRGGLRFGAQPASVVAGRILSPAVTVSVLDVFGNLLTTDNSPIALALAPGAGGTLGGTTTRAVVGGVATFNDLFVQKAGTFTLTASVPGLAQSVSQGFTISPAVAARLVFLTQPASTVAGAVLAPVVVQVVDAFGNRVVRPGVAVTVRISSGALSGTRTVLTNALGYAVFTDLRIFLTGTYFLNATADGFGAVSSPWFSILQAGR